MKKAISISACVELLKQGGVVGMPTETVYGLAADARRDDGVAKIFTLKGRPSTNPLIVHVASVEVAERYAVVNDRARKLFAAFSPGPLTVVLPLLLPLPLGEGRGEGLTNSQRRLNTPRTHPNPLPEGEGIVSRLVTAGLNTVGIRIPSHPLALELLRAFDGPLAAPSANKSNHISPTTAGHVRSEFGNDVPVLDGGACEVGIESTVLTLAAERPTILRPGSISRDAIETIIGPVDVFAGHLTTNIAAASPGQSEKHYAPRAEAYRLDKELFRCFPFVVGDTYIAFGQFESYARGVDLGDDPKFAARNFYGTLRALDDENPRYIHIEFPPDEPKWAALRDRIRRATKPMTVESPTSESRNASLHGGAKWTSLFGLLRRRR